MVNDTFTFVGAFVVGDKVRLKMLVQVENYAFREKHRCYKSIPAFTTGEIIVSSYAKDYGILADVSVNEYTVQLPTGDKYENIPEYLLEPA